MDPWTAIAKAIVYPFAKAMADAWFDARAKYETTVEETPNNEDRNRADNFRNAVAGVQPDPEKTRDP
jgi:hypothetical protein